MPHTSDKRVQLHIDQAFAEDSMSGPHRERTYGGAQSFFRRRYTKNLTGVDMAIVGIPYDLATSNRPGARFGPRGIREASSQIANSLPWPHGFDPTKRLTIIDYGDFGFDFGYPHRIPKEIQTQASAILRKRVSLLVMGGDHFISLPLLRAHHAIYGPLALVHFDAHSDTWPNPVGRITHGSMFFHAVNEGLIDPQHSIQIGIRTHNPDPLGIAWLDMNWLTSHSTREATARIKKIVGKHRAYLTFDIDCIDPAYAPGTGTPVIGGVSTREARALLNGLGGIQFVGMDMVEVAPNYDHGDITSLAAATLMLDYICLRAL